MRTFIAVKIKPEPALLESVSRLKKELAGEPIKWVDEQNLHLTLKFLGNTTEEQAVLIKGKLADYASMQRPVSFILSGMGYFKSNGMPRVLFIDVRDGENLQQLAEGVEALLLPMGFEKESRRFNPHLTLARIKFLKNKMQFYKAVEVNKYHSSVPVTINKIIYFQSNITPAGPEYRELGVYPLAAP